MKLRLDWILFGIAASFLLLVLSTQSWEESRTNTASWFTSEGIPMLVALVLCSTMIIAGTFLLIRKLQVDE